MDSLVISSTPLAEIPQQTRSMSREEWEARNVLFQTDDQHEYIGKLFEKLNITED